GVRRSDRGSRGGGARGRCAEDAVEGRLRGEDRSARGAAGHPPAWGWGRGAAGPVGRDRVVGIYYPPPAIRDLRELCRYRCHLARLQASLKQRIHALLLRHGVQVPVKGLFTARGTAWLETLTLPGWAGASLTGLRQVVTDVRAQLL